MWEQLGQALQLRGMAFAQAGLLAGGSGTFVTSEVSLLEKVPCTSGISWLFLLLNTPVPREAEHSPVSINSLARSWQRLEGRLEGLEKGRCWRRRTESAKNAPASPSFARSSHT